MYPRGFELADGDAEIDGAAEADAEGVTEGDTDGDAVGDAVGDEDGVGGIAEERVGWSKTQASTTDAKAIWLARFAFMFTQIQ
jgi:hypothetical protein